MWSSLVVSLLALPLQSSAPAPRATPPQRFERVVVVGASVSAGFALGDELKAKVTFADFFSAAIRREPSSVTAHASGTFYLDPLGKGAELIADALADEPTLLIAADFLFWFGYGPMPDEYRSARLERGLALLDAVEVPLLVADLPDMRRALDGTSPIGPLMFPDYLPSDATRAALNARIEGWAEERGETVVLPLAQHVADVFAGESIEVHGTTVKGEAERLLQADLLHPTTAGTVLLALFALDRLHAAELVPGEEVDWGLEAVEKRVWERTAAEREKNLERERKREERRKRNAERKAKREAEKEAADRAGSGGEAGRALLETPWTPRAKPDFLSWCTMRAQESLWGPKPAPWRNPGALCSVH